jgi:SagB-type dehydrogenase family enzyme
VPGIPSETYLAVNNVTGLEPGIYRYSALNHSLVFHRKVDGLGIKLTEASVGQSFVGKAPVVFIWSCKPYLGEWRYMGESHKVMLLDAGHVCQNLYLSAEALGLGTVGIGTYSQKLIDKLLQLDGEEEFVVYFAPVGKPW